jgi:hypothetical protein
MWVFLSSRIRRWLLLAVAVPVVRAIVHRLAVAAHDRQADSIASRVLVKADSGLARISRSADKRRR